MIRGDAQVMAGIVRGVEKRTHRPIVDGIVSGIPRKAVPSAATPVEKCMTSATPLAQGAFGAGVFGEGAGMAKMHKSEKMDVDSDKPKRRGRAKKVSMEDGSESDTTKKGMMRKTARKAYE